MKTNQITVGLFGTCGNSTWRDTFMTHYAANSIPFFNPQVTDWTPECAVIEANHLVNDDVILFPVTDETYGSGSLAETGFSILSALKSPTQRFTVVMIADAPAEHLKTDVVAYKESCRARALVKAHLKKQQATTPSLFVVSSLEEMLEVSVKLYQVAETLKAARLLCLAD